MIAVATAIRTV